MRVTNSMVYGTAMNDIWRNARYLNKLVTQIETGKLIQRPSDDPFISSRSLRYRTILSETEQFLRNAEQGMAWMEVSEAAFNSILTGSPTQPSAMQRINTRLLEAAQTGTNTVDDQRAILAELKQYYNQMFGVDMNQTYLGRYVFSGFHTDQPPVLKTDQPGRSFLITQTFQAQDLERTIAFHRPSPTDMPMDRKINVLKLPYNNVDFNFPTAGIVNPSPPTFPTPIPVPGITLADGTVLHIQTMVSTELDAYRPLDSMTVAGVEMPVIHYLRDTGELVMSDAVRELFENAGGISVTYEKNNLTAGELNPIVYFECAEVVFNAATGVFEAVHYSTRGHDIQIEISPNAYNIINSHARDILTANLFADLKRLFDFSDSLVSSDPRVIEEYYRGAPHFYTGDELNEAVQKFLSDEQAMFSGAIHNRINNMLELIMRHANQAQREHTALGSKMARLEMIQIRLEEDEVAFTALLSENEDTPLSDTIMRKTGAEAAFGYALMAVARTTQLSLADFINR